VAGALQRGFVAGHADAVRDDFCEDFVVPDGRQLEPFKPQIIFAI
jgi:hypothetical protein